MTLNRWCALRTKRDAGTLMLKETQELHKAGAVLDGVIQAGYAVTGLPPPRRSPREALRELRRVVTLARSRIRTCRSRPPRRRAKRPPASRPHTFRRTRSTPARGPDSDDTPGDHPRLRLRAPGSSGREAGR